MTSISDSIVPDSISEENPKPTETPDKVSTFTENQILYQHIAHLRMYFLFSSDKFSVLLDAIMKMSDCQELEGIRGESEENLAELHRNFGAFSKEYELAEGAGVSSLKNYMFQCVYDTNLFLKRASEDTVPTDEVKKFREEFFDQFKIMTDDYKVLLERKNDELEHLARLVSKERREKSSLETLCRMYEKMLRSDGGLKARYPKSSKSKRIKVRK
jgi:hypothetical protein